MSQDLADTAQCYGVYDVDKIIAFIAIIHYPHPQNKKLKKVHRVVVLPDYQGIGIGSKLIDTVSKMYYDQGYDLRCSTTSISLISHFNKSPKWRCTFAGTSKFKEVPKGIDVGVGCRKNARKNVKLYTFQYIEKN